MKDLDLHTERIGEIQLDVNQRHYQTVLTDLRIKLPNYLKLFYASFIDLCIGVTADKFTVGTYKYIYRYQRADYLLVLNLYGTNHVEHNEYLLYDAIQADRISTRAW